MQPPNNQEQVDDIDHRYSSLLEGNAKKISCTHEIIFNITASVMKEDEEGNDVGYEQISTKYYHIPVKEGADYKQFMNSFFSFLEKSLASSAKHAYESSPNEIDVTEGANKNE
jgi:hypothetical protein